jgi:hypothetical protein
LGVKSLLALAAEQPSSPALLGHCWRLLHDKEGAAPGRLSHWHAQRNQWEVPYVLRQHFADSEEVKERLRTLFRRNGPAVAALVMLAPADPALSQLRPPLEIGQETRDWPVALHVAAARSDADEFVMVLRAMLSRPLTTIWHFQDITNRAVVDRLQRDSAVVDVLRQILTSDPSDSERASIPRYLRAAGRLDEDLLGQCRQLLRAEESRRIPQAGYDAISDEVRGIALSLLDALGPTFQ